MSETIDLKNEKYSAKLRYEGIVDMEAFFQLIKNWLSDRHFEFHEKAHKKKPMERGFEYEVEMYGKRKETDYVIFMVNVYIHAFFTEDVEIVENGIKKKMQKAGTMIVEVWPTMILDWQNRWETSAFKKKLRSFFHKYIIKTYINVLWLDRLYYITYKLHTKIKEFLDYESKYNAYEDIWQT